MQHLRQQPLLAGSLALNLAFGLAAALGWLSPDHTPPKLPASQAVSPSSKEKKIPTKAAASAKPPVFQWSQLEAPDFATFVKNLRAIGCPEVTIRDILAGEVNEIYDLKIQALMQQSSTAGGHSSKSHAGTAEQAARNQLNEEKTRLLASLLSPAAPLGDAAATHPGPQAAPPSASGAPPPPNRATMTPAAFLVGNNPQQSGNSQELSTTATDPQLDAGTRQIVEQLRTRFASSLQTAGSLDPSSAEYYELWDKSRRESDDRFSSMFGGDAFIKAQLDANRTAANSAAK